MPKVYLTNSLPTLGDFIDYRGHTFKNMTGFVYLQKRVIVHHCRKNTEVDKRLILLFYIWFEKSFINK